MRSVCIAGASGFIGKNLLYRFKKEGYKVSCITRSDFQKGDLYVKIRNCSIVINLAGESIAGIWTKRKKDRIYESRVMTTRKLVKAINLARGEPKLVIQVSGVGIYDNQNIHTEESNNYDGGFLGQVIRDWEGELVNLRKDDLRIVILRMGIVLDKNGGFLKQILFPLKFGMAFGVRSDSFFPFIELEDLMNIFDFSIERNTIHGIVNVAAPTLTKINHFFKEVARVKNKRIILWFNTGFIRLIMGESGNLLTSGQRVIPRKLMDEGFVFRAENIEDALDKACN